MKKYYYKALKEQKEVVSGYIDAENQQEARKLIKQMGFMPTSVYEEALNQQSVVELKNKKQVRLSLEDKISFTSELHNLLSSSISILDALATVEKYSPKVKIAQIAHDLLESIKCGASFSDALGQYSKTFGAIYIALCKSGEAAGSLPEVLDYLLVLLKKQNSLKGKFIQMSIYPAILVVMMTGLFFTAGGYIFPKIILQMSIDNVPPLASFFVDSVSFICNYWFWIIISLFGIWYGLKCVCDFEALKDKFSRFCLNLPVLGNCIRYFSLAHYMSVLHIAYESGIPIVEALEMAEGTISIKLIKEQAADVVKMARQGKGLTEAFELSHLMPGIIMPLVATGEKTGKLGQMFRDAALGIERKLDMAMEVLAKTFEPLLILVIGVFAAIIAVAIIQMYAQSISAMGGFF